MSGASILEVPFDPFPGDGGLPKRVRRTLRLFAAWGHATTLDHLGRHLMGGEVDPGVLRRLFRTSNLATVRDGFVALPGDVPLLAETRARLEAHAASEEGYLRLARAFSRELLAWCPFVQCIALTGSLAVGAFREGDDVDFDLFVEGSTKYITYLLSTLLGARYAWRHRHRTVDVRHETPLLPKLTCVNVVWRETETRPFVRTDEHLAYELLRCRPLYGSERFREVLADNPWLRAHFPQIYHRPLADAIPEVPLNLVGRLLRALARWPRLLRALEVVSRGVTWSLYQVVQWSRRHNAEAQAHLEFLRRVKHPYEVFQD